MSQDLLVSANAETRHHSLLRLVRPHRLVKNLIAYAPIVLAMKVHDSDLFGLATLCVISLCLVSAANYVLNDVLDAADDSLHPSRKLRPVASGQVSRTKAICIGAVLAIVGLTISFLVRPSLCLVVLAFFGLNLLYSCVLKHHMLIDVFAIAAGLVLRAVAGAVAVSVPVSPWFLLCMTLGALFLALEKRRHEVFAEEGVGVEVTGLPAYSPALLDRMEAVVVASLLTSYAAYTFLSAHGQWMMITVPFVIYGIMRYQLLSAANRISDSPEDVLFRDRPMQLTIAGWWLTCACVVYGAPQGMITASQALDCLQTLPVAQQTQRNSALEQFSLDGVLPASARGLPNQDDPGPRQEQAPDHL